MFGSGGRGNFASKSQCESYRISRPGFESMNSYCSGFDRYVAPAPPASFRAIERPVFRRAGSTAQSGGARGAAQAAGRGRQAARAGCRHGTASRHAAAAAIRPGQKHPGERSAQSPERLRGHELAGAERLLGGPGGPGSPEGRSGQCEKLCRLLHRGPGGQIRPGVPCGAIPCGPHAAGRGDR